MKRSILSVWLLALLVNVWPAELSAASRSFYALKVYHVKNDKQESIVEDYLRSAYLPALHRAGIPTVGVFKPVVSQDAATAAEKLIYVLLPFSSYKDFSVLQEKLDKDQQYQSDGHVYLDATLSDPPFDRIETILLNAFPASPKLMLPKLSSPKSERIYELRSYEGPTEKLSRNKILMFNKGDEIGLFKRLNFNAVFYGEVVAGSRMPNLMYMTTFENKADRDAHWKAFSEDAYWKKLSAMPEYQNNVSRNDTRFLRPTDFSDI